VAANGRRRPAILVAALQSFRMSGIVGIWNLAGEPVDERVLARQITALGHRGDHHDHWISGSIALASRFWWAVPESRTETQPFLRRGIAVVFDGRLDNRDDLLAALDDDPEMTGRA